MRGGRFSVVAGFVLVVMLVAGCSGEDPTTPAAPAPPTAASESPSPEPTASPDPYAIPDDPADIDEAYVERVLEALLNSVPEAAREVVEGRMTPNARRILASSHRGDALRAIVRAFRTGIADDVFVPDPGDVDVEIDDILDASTSCIWTLTSVDTSELVGQEIEPFPTYYFLAVKQPDEDPDGLNPTPWIIAGDAGPPDQGEEYDNPCS